jgi:hypothetical protein
MPTQTPRADRARLVLVATALLWIASCAPGAVTVATDVATGGRPGFAGRVQQLDPAIAVPPSSEWLGYVCVPAPDLSHLPTMWETAAATAAARLGANTIQRVSQIDASAANLFIPGMGRSRAASGAATGLPIIPPELRGCYTQRALLIVRAYWVPGLDGSP